MRNIIYPTIGILILLLIWQLLAAAIGMAWLLPPPASVVVSLIDNAPLLAHHSLYTIAEALIGLAASTVLACLIAFIMSLLPLVRKICYPLLLISQMIPIIVLAPLFLIWFGYGMLPKILVVVLICFFPIAINMIVGLSAADEQMLLFYRSLGASRGQLLRLIRLPLALPYFFSGLRIAAAYSIMGAVIGEWLGAQSGLGLLLTRAQRAFDLPLVLAAIIVIILLSCLLFAIIKIFEKKFSPAS